MKVRYTAPAARELRDILDHIALHSPSGARRVLTRLRSIEEMLGAFPETGRPIRFGLRQITVLPYPYLVFYECTKDAVVIHRVRHSSRRREF